jgi:hypothetical protein
MWLNSFSKKTPLVLINEHDPEVAAAWLLLMLINALASIPC